MLLLEALTAFFVVVSALCAVVRILILRHLAVHNGLVFPGRIFDDALPLACVPRPAVSCETSSPSPACQREAPVRQLSGERQREAPGRRLSADREREAPVRRDPVNAQRGGALTLVIDNSLRGRQVERRRQPGDPDEHGRRLLVLTSVEREAYRRSLRGEGEDPRD